MVRMANHLMPKIQSLKTVSPINPMLPYLGGKRRLAKLICAKIDQIPHKSYIEPFCGMGGIFFRRSSRPKSEVINDLSGDVANFFRVTRKHPDALMAELRFQTSCRNEFQRQKLLPVAALTDIERAARFFFLQRCAFGGKVTHRSFGVTRDGRPGRFSSTAANQYITALHKRLETTVVEQLPYEDILTRYDHASALFYLDPPYWGNENDYGKGLFTPTDFVNLAKILSQIKGHFILSLNDRQEVREIFSNFLIDNVTTTYSVARNNPMCAGELIISNT